MKSREYIIKGLNALVEKFPSLIFKYKFDAAEITHIIAVEPLSEFEGNKAYLVEESDFVYDFENKYLPETIMFVSTNSLTTVNEPDMVFESGKLKFEFVQTQQYSPSYNFKCNLDEIEVGKADYNLAA